MTSAPNINKLPINNGLEVAFVGVSNAGKSSLINALCNQNNLCKTSSTPGRTQLINLFSVAPYCNIVDLPGYGYAAVPEKLKIAWQKSLGNYLEKREYLAGIVLLMDSRHPLKPLDQQMLDWATTFNIPIIIALTKIDKLKQQEFIKTMNLVKQALVKYVVASEDNPNPQEIKVIPCSSTKRRGVDQIAQQLDEWFSPVTSKYKEMGIINMHPMTKEDLLATDISIIDQASVLGSMVSNLENDGFLAQSIVSPVTKGRSRKQRYSPTARRLGTSKPFVEPPKTGVYSRYNKKK